jgi:hypothetical protein
MILAWQPVPIHSPRLAFLAPDRPRTHGSPSLVAGARSVSTWRSRAQGHKSYQIGRMATGRLAEAQGSSVSCGHLAVLAPGGFFLILDSGEDFVAHQEPGMGESARAQSAPPAAGALGGLLAVQVRRAAVRLPCLAPARGPVPVPPADERNENVYRLIAMPSGQSEAGAAEWRDRPSRSAGESGSGRRQRPHRRRSARVR